MRWQGVAVLLFGISLVSLAGVEIFARRVCAGPPDPDGAGHMAIFIYPIMLFAGVILTVVSAMLVGAKPFVSSVVTTGAPLEDGPPQ
jgi:hypothetical protein